MKLRKYIINFVIGIGIAVVGFFLAGFLASLKDPQVKKTPPPQTVNVTVASVAYTDQETELEYFGRVKSFQSAAIIAEVQGLLQQGAVALQNGQQVRKGQLLFSVDDRETRMNLKSQKSQFMKSIADILADLKVDFPNSYESWQSYFESIDVDKPLPDLPEVKDMKEKTFLATRGIQSSFYSIMAAQERLGKYRTYAPFSGSLSNVVLEPGSVVNPGSRIATLTRTDQLELAIPVKNEDLKWLEQGTEVNVNSEEANQSWKGKITRIGDRVDPATQSVNVYVKVMPAKDAPILEGQYLKASLPGKVVRKAFEVPRRAIFDKDRVYLVQDGKLASSQVVVHKKNPTTAIISGVPAGSQLVIEPPLNASESMAVNPIAQ